MYNFRVENARSEYPAILIFDSLRYFTFIVSKIFWRIKYSGAENIPYDSESGLIIASNHQTYIDPVWICFPVKRKMRFMAWERVFEWFLIGKIIRYLGAFPVNTIRGKKSSYKQALNTLQEGGALIIFPESGRAFSDGKLLPFKHGAVKLAIESNSPILPVTIRGAHRVWARDMKYPHFGKVEIIFHPVLQIPKPPNEKEQNKILVDFTNKLAEVIGADL